MSPSAPDTSGDGGGRRVSSPGFWPFEPTAAAGEGAGERSESRSTALTWGVYEKGIKLKLSGNDVYYTAFPSDTQVFV